MEENKTNEEHEHDCGCDEEHGCGDDCGCNEEHEDMMHLILDDDTEVDCYVLGVFDVEEREYIALVPEDSEDVLIYRYEENEEGPILDSIEEDDEYEKVGKVFDELFSEMIEEQEEESKE